MRVAHTATRGRTTSPALDPMASTHVISRPHRRRRTFVLPSVAILRPLPIRAALGRLGHERTVAVAIAGIVLGASFLSVAPGGLGGDTGGPKGDGPTPRLGIGGPVGDDGDLYGRVEAAYVDDAAAEESSTDTYAAKPALAANAQPRLDDLEGVDPAAVALAFAPVVEGPFLDDGTLLKPVAVDTSVADGSALIRTYKVKAGDTLAGIAAKFDVSTMTLWWANKLKAKNALVRGQELRIPPVSGLVVEVTPTDTLASLARRYKIAEDEILTTNKLEDRNLVVGQVLVLPDARGAPIATPKPSKKPTVRSSGGSSGSSGGTRVRAPKTYSGGNFAWPTSSRHVSQYYHYGHYGIDIDGSTGDPIYAAASGTVTFAGWKNNGGGYQVWISHGSGLYTTYNHMSSVSIGRGQHVGRGQRVGRMGATGFATGSHLHFEVWKGPIWNGGSRVNPLAYL
jgi:murein DD-endopeptidase MepM/ murein hydrolase activator NlpD